MMKSAENLSFEELVRIVRALQGILYQEIGEREQVFNPDKVWDSDMPQLIAELLHEYGLTPQFLGDEPEGPESRCDICGGPNH